MNREIEEEIQRLRREGKQIYSFSKLSTFHNCQWEYYNTYILKNRGLNNCYTELGTVIHEGIENIYAGTGNLDSFKESYANKLIEIEMLGYDFPSEKIKDSWIADVNHFINHFNKLDTKMLIEKMVLFKVTDDIYLRGAIDGIVPSEKGKPYVNIIDWKTSSKFTGKKVHEAGRQLLLYKLGLEDNTDLKVDKIMWCMVKYTYVCTKLKNGNIRKKMCNRGKWVKEMKDQLEKELYKLNINEFEIEIMIDEAIKANDIKCLPEEIQDKFWLEDCFVEYEPKEERIQELKKYVIDTVTEIESKNPNNVAEWSDIGGNTFYCNVLCSHRNTCPTRKAFLEQHSGEFEKKDKTNDFDIFG